LYLFYLAMMSSLQRYKPPPLVLLRYFQFGTFDAKDYPAPRLSGN